MIGSVPLHLRCKEFHSLKVVEIDGFVQNLKRQLIQSLEQIVKDSDSNELDSLIKDVCQNYKELRANEESSVRLQRQVSEAKQQYKRLSETLPPLSIETWDQYAREPAPSLKDFMTQDVEAELPLTQEDRILRALPHVWQDPQCLLPDDTEGDDLQIRGGRIELVCPITCKPFENPMISTKCGHVFDSSGLSNYFESYPSRDCPQGACLQKLTLRDFKVDELMKLRCLLHLKKVRQEETNLDVL
ncbi:hypothetical protein ZYGR_0AL01370 [Zygosaccharomyces rouxii]|uniref:SP-RING-type domain-containing protein n=1 Tax=Zygosaccharomyces rouxii TaxID=4956 RepID=A0A1Q3AFK5_ZYGRO|nr:hypothetical protein ZYGR_0AL01370 [Zygosaccharomyces rouxii]